MMRTIMNRSFTPMRTLTPLHLRRPILTCSMSELSVPVVFAMSCHYNKQCISVNFAQITHAKILLYSVHAHSTP